jgi:hypothetical protein
MAKEIELGNGYGYFCNIHDMENQKPIVEPIHINNYRKYLEEIDGVSEACVRYYPFYRLRGKTENERRERTSSTDFNDKICSCALFSFMVVVCCFIL